jgi:quercetin dioxygenase-like cupin family protein
VNKLRYTLGSIAVVAFAGMALASPGTATPTPTRAAAMPAHDHHAQHSNQIVYGPAPDVFPPGAEMAVLQGDPSVAGAIFTVRLRLPNGYIIPPHFHPTDENVTVIKGTFKVGLGDHVDKDAFLPPLYRGDFITAPANANHFAQAKGRTEVQVHAIGPFQMTYVNPADDPRTPK